MPRPETSRNMRHPNIALLANRAVEDSSHGFNHVFITDKITDLHSLSLKEANYFFPLYLYPPPSEGLGLHAFDFPVDARGRTPNLSKAFIEALSAAIELQFAPDSETGGDTTRYTPEDVFYYIYAVLHSPSYRTRYADFLRSDFPRVPLPDTADRFWTLAALGAELAGLHLLKTAPKLGGFPKTGDNEVVKGYPKFTPPETGESVGKVMISPQQWFAGVPPEVWAFRVGGYQVAEKWLKDRRGRVLSFEDVQHYQRTLGALAGTLGLMARVDDGIEGLLG